MNDLSLEIEQRILDEANYIIDTKKALRELTKYFKVSKSTIHNDLHNRLKKINSELYDKVSIILKFNSDVKHIRGGISTRLKYTKEKHEK